MIKNKYDSKFINAFNGPCIVIGSGPSSKELDDFDLWKNYFSISINFSQIKYPSPIIIYQDNQVFEVLSSYFAKNKVFVIYIKNNYILTASYKTIKNDYIYGMQIDEKLSVGEEPKFEINNNKITSSMLLTGYQGLVLAHLFGFSPVYAIGFDAHDSSYEYANQHPIHHGMAQQAALRHINNCIVFMKKYAVEYNIINCSESKEIWGIKGNIKDIQDYKPNYKETMDRLNKILYSKLNNKSKFIWEIKKEIK